MANVFFDEFFEFNQYDIDTGDNVFETILSLREGGYDSKRFFVDYVPQEVVSGYDFNNPDSLKEFRKICHTVKSPLRTIGGCNMLPEKLKEDIIYAGIKLSDPDKKIPGQFDIRNQTVTYSPIFPSFFDERDLIKFASDTYFTTLTFKELIINQINHAKKFYVHVGNYQKIKEIAKHGSYILEKVTQKEMIEYATNPELGNKVLGKYLDSLHHYQ